MPSGRLARWLRGYQPWRLQFYFWEPQVILSPPHAHHPHTIIFFLQWGGGVVARFCFHIQWERSTLVQIPPKQRLTSSLYLDLWITTALEGTVDSGFRMLNSGFGLVCSWRFFHSSKVISWTWFSSSTSNSGTLYITTKKFFGQWDQMSTKKSYTFVALYHEYKVKSNPNAWSHIFWVLSLPSYPILHCKQ